MFLFLLRSQQVRETTLHVCILLALKRIGTLCDSSTALSVYTKNTTYTGVWFFLKKIKLPYMWLNPKFRVAKRSLSCLKGWWILGFWTASTGGSCRWRASKIPRRTKRRSWWGKFVFCAAHITFHLLSPLQGFWPLCDCLRLWRVHGPGLLGDATGGDLEGQGREGEDPGRRGRGRGEVQGRLPGRGGEGDNARWDCCCRSGPPSRSQNQSQESAVKRDELAGGERGIGSQAFSRKKPATYVHTKMQKISRTGSSRKKVSPHVFL